MKCRATAKAGEPAWPAMAVSVALGFLLPASLDALDVATVVTRDHAPTVVEMLSEPPPPPSAASPPVPARPAETILPRTPVVAPQPPMPTLLPPAQATAASVPSPPVPAPPAAAPVPVVAAPAIENAGDLSSKMIEARPPRYPMDSRRKHEEGTVLLSVLLGTDGRVAEISVAHSSGFDRLDRAALEAVRRWRWSPTRRGGVPVMVRGLVEIPFELTRR